MRKYMLLIALFSSFRGFAQKDSVSVSLSSLARFEESTEVLYLAIFIKSTFPSPVIIDDTQVWIHCGDERKVRLESQYWADSVFTEYGGGDCHPEYVIDSDLVRFPLTLKTIGPHQSYNYLISAMDIVRLHKYSDTTRLSVAKGLYRFRINVPYWVGKTRFIARSRWLYYSRP